MAPSHPTVPEIEGDGVEAHRRDACAIRDEEERTVKIPTDPEGLDRLREVALVQSDAHVESGRRLLAQIDRHVEGSAALSTVLAEGGSLRDALLAFELPEIRPASTAAIADFERTRHTARLMLMAVALAEGASHHELQTLWQVSNELVRRTVREIAELPEPDA